MKINKIWAPTILGVCILPAVLVTSCNDKTNDVIKLDDSYSVVKSSIVYINFKSYAIMDEYCIAIHLIGVSVTLDSEPNVSGSNYFT
jgi:hypothetical protein